ncbi:PilZ domain-containing protein [Nannocystaceae bacterium ST9]
MADASESGSRRFASGPVPSSREAARLLRLRADERLAGMLEPSRSLGEAGFIKVPSREGLSVGDSIRVEVSFGAMADEIVLRGAVDAIVAREGGRAPIVAIRVVPEHAARLRYVDEVVSNGRAATARASRRVPSQIPATWFWGLGSHATRIGDISRGGAFIRSAAPPPVGNKLELELNDGMVEGPRRGPFRLEAVVAWTGSSQGTRGFGVKFRIVDREQADRVAALVRWHEYEAGLID